MANGEEFDKIINDLDVMSRSRPEDKYAMVVGLIERGNVVAVTGDGKWRVEGPEGTRSVIYLSITYECVHTTTYYILHTTYCLNIRYIFMYYI